MGQKHLYVQAISFCVAHKQPLFLNEQTEAQRG